MFGERMVRAFEAVKDAFRAARAAQPGEDRARAEDG